MTCHYCQKNIQEVDFKNTEVLSKFVSAQYKIKARKKSGLCTKHQKGVAKAIKRARQLGTMPYLPQ